MRCRGITLLELIITVAIIAILASIAYPSFQAHMLKSRRAEALEHLLSAQLKQEEQRVTSGSYTTDFALLGGASIDHYTFASTVSGASYTLTATVSSGSPKLKDTGCTTLTINQQDQKTPANCWG